MNIPKVIERRILKIVYNPYITWIIRLVILIFMFFKCILKEDRNKTEKAPIRFRNLGGFNLNGTSYNLFN